MVCVDELGDLKQRRTDKHRTFLQIIVSKHDFLYFSKVCASVEPSIVRVRGVWCQKRE